MSHLHNVVERVGTRNSGNVEAQNGWVDEAAPQFRQTERRASPKAARRSARTRSASIDFYLYEDSEGRQHFNFVQRIWLYPCVQMAVTPVMSLELKTLAVNLLTPLTRERDYPAAVGVTSKRVMKLANRFCEECLMTADATALLIPRATIRAWLRWRARDQDPARFGAGASQQNRRIAGARGVR
jgi:hypothetical protein